MKANRRDLLKLLSLAGGAASISATPDKWVKPVVTSLVLPTHAQTTGCSGSITTESDPSPESDTDIAVMYDCDTCFLQTGVWPNGDGLPADAVFAVDVDHNDGQTFDIIGPGSNWDITGGNVPEPPDDISPGTWMISASGNGCLIDVTFTVEVSASNNPTRTMTLSNVIIDNLTA